MPSDDRFPGERLDQLLRDLLGGWVGGGVQRKELPPLEAQHHEHEQQLERDRWHDREVHSHHIAKMVLQERSPSLRGRLRLSGEVLRDGRLRQRESQLEELAMDPRCTPRGVCLMHLQDELSNLGIDWRSARAQRSALPAPVESESLAVPPDDGLRLNDHEGLTPSGPEAREPGPEDAIRCSKPNSSPGTLAFQGEYLMAKGKHFRVKWKLGSGRARGRRRGRPEGQAASQITLAHGARELNDYAVDGIVGRDSLEADYVIVTDLVGGGGSAFDFPSTREDDPVAATGAWLVDPSGPMADLILQYGGEDRGYGATQLPRQPPTLLACPPASHPGDDFIGVEMRLTRGRLQSSTCRLVGWRR